MTRLTSVQEAAFNAAGEAALDLGFKITVAFAGTAEAPKFYAFCDKPNRKPHSYDSTFSEHCSTAAEAVQSLLDKREAVLSEPPKLEGAADAIDAVRELIDTTPDLDRDSLLDKINALPVAD